MITPNTSPVPIPRSLPLDPSSISILTSSHIFTQILSYAPRSTISTCLRVSTPISHIAASILYRDISLIHILPPAIVTPHVQGPDTRSPFLSYVRTLRLPPHLLYDPALCFSVISKMDRLKTVIVPGDWQGWILRLDPYPPIFTSPDIPHRNLRIIVTGLKSPASLINNGLLQSDLLSQSSELVLNIDHLNPVYRGPRQRVTAAMNGKRYSMDIPECIKKVTIILPQNPEIGGFRLPAGFDMGADSGFFPAFLHIPAEEPDVAPDLARMLWGRKSNCEITVILRDQVSKGESSQEEMEAEEDKSRAKLQELQERTELLANGVSGSLGHHDATLGSKVAVRWIRASDWRGRDEIDDLLRGSGGSV